MCGKLVCGDELLDILVDFVKLVIFEISETAESAYT
jgi:hypothetical protein